MAIKINGQDLQKRIINGQEVQKVMLNGNQIRPSSPVVNDYLCFEPATIEGCEITLQGPSETNIQLEISYDKSNWLDYVLDNPISLNYGQKVYWRNKSETQTSFSRVGYLFIFSINGATNASGDVNFLLCKNSTRDLTASGDNVFFLLFNGCDDLITPPQLPATTLTIYCYDSMFSNCTSLTTPPQLPATTLADYCYNRIFEGCTSLITPLQLPATTLAEGCYSEMFSNCTSLITLPQLPATTLADYCYDNMFAFCENIKLSETQTGIYQTPYRIPSQGTGTAGPGSLFFMFNSTGGTFTGTPNINQTYYTSNQVI